MMQQGQSRPHDQYNRADRTMTHTHDDDNEHNDGGGDTMRTTDGAVAAAGGVAIS